MKQCKGCAKEGIGPKPFSEFNKCSRSKDGRYSWCRVHSAAKLRAAYARSGTKYNERKKVWRKENPAAARILDVRKQLVHKYGLTQLQYERLFDRQHGRCALCEKALLSQFDEAREFTKGLKVANVAYVDHCHKTGSVRGLLCFNCNILLGKAADDQQLLLKAARYLDASRTAQAQPAAERESVSEIEPAMGPRIKQSRGNRRDELSPFFN